MSIIFKKVILFVTLLFSGVTIGLIIKNDPEGKDLLSHWLTAISSFLIGIGVWFGSISKKKK